MAINEEVITVNLNVNITKSERQLKKTEARLKKIQDLAAGISKGTSLIDARSVKGGKAALEGFKKTLEDLAKSNKNYATTTAGLDRQLGKLRATFRGISTDAKEFKNALVASEKVQRQLYKAQQETRAIRGRALTGGEAGGIVSELIAQKGEVYQSISALRAYRSELTRLKDAVRMNSSEFNELEKEIKRVDGILNKPKKKPNIKSVGGGVLGREKALQEALRIQNETESSALGYRDAVLGVREAQKSLNAELRQAARIQAQISQSTVSWGRAFTDLKKIGGGLAGGLANVGGKAGGVLKGIGSSRIGQIGSARIFSDLIKKVPVVDKAFGRLLQKIPLFGKLLNENTSVNARWAAQILEGITGITLAWNGLNQIISAAQAFTAFERQAAIAINRVARMFKEMYNVAGAMMMGLISPGQVGKNLWSQALDRPDVMAARRGPSSIERLELQQAKKKAELKNTEISDEGRLQVISRQILEIENAITDETRQRVLLAKQYQDAMMKGPVWTQYGSPAGPGSKGAGWGSNAQDRLGDVQLRIGEAITANSLENRNAVSKLFLEEKKVNAELARRKEILRVIRQGVENVNLSVQAQRDLFGTSNAEALQAQKQQSPLYANDPNANAARRRAGKRGAIQRRRQRSQILREGLMLGAGFPVLFGGGPGAILGGAGGALWQGTRKKPERGFGGQILASAAGQVLDRIVAQSVAATAKLGQAFNKFSLDVTAITKSLGVAGTATAQYLQTLEAVKGPIAAANEAQERLKSIIGEKGVADLKEFGERSQSILNSTQKFFTQMTAGLANILNWADKILNISGGLEQRDIRNFGMTDDDEELVRLRGQLKALGKNKLTRRDDAPFNAKFAEIDARAKEVMTGQTQEDFISNATLALDKNIEKLEESLSLGTREAEIQQEIASILKEKNILNNKDNEEAIKGIEARVRSKKLLEEQLALWNQIKDTIATGLTSAIEGLIDGTKSLGESLASIAKSIGSMLLQSAISGWLAPIGLPKIPGGTAPGAAEGMYMANGIKPFAYGGVATRPTLGLVGEAGEDEYIIPASKMAASMQRYSAGARGEAVIPGTGSSHVGAGGGASTTVNYSGPILNFNSEEFVPKSAVGQIIATATSQGAKAGESRTLSTLRNSRSTRSRLGM